MNQMQSPRRYLEGVIAKALGGRAAELVFFGADEITLGAGSDLVQATSIARRMVAEYCALSRLSQRAIQEDNSPVENLGHHQLSHAHAQ